ncbi:hypothetical protein KIL84_012803 [Mauremys mutica]|uniref:Uncharacterized protein n=1 Tax=Mauremys mutica TaxID=74926 RepID=A0A9D3XS80_9SAUR|nr:hypothetical protein KIL84_012803 [Mauremys mutica]
MLILTAANYPGVLRWPVSPWEPTNRSHSEKGKGRSYEITLGWRGRGSPGRGSPVARDIYRGAGAQSRPGAGPAQQDGVGPCRCRWLGAGGAQRPGFPEREGAAGQAP